MFSVFFGNVAVKECSSFMDCQTAVKYIYIHQCTLQPSNIYINFSIVTDKTRVWLGEKKKKKIQNHIFYLLGTIRAACHQSVLRGEVQFDSITLLPLPPTYCTMSTFRKSFFKKCFIFSNHKMADGDMSLAPPLRLTVIFSLCDQATLSLVTQQIFL